MDFYNVEFRPIIEKGCDGEETAILEKIPPPPLHLKLGAVNSLLDLMERLDQEAYNAFVKCLHIVKENYHGKTFEGNECSKALANLDKLRNGCNTDKCN